MWQEEVRAAKTMTRVLRVERAEQVARGRPEALGETQLQTVSVSAAVVHMCTMLWLLWCDFGEGVR